MTVTTYFPLTAQFQVKVFFRKDGYDPETKMSAEEYETQHDSQTIPYGPEEFLGIVRTGADKVYCDVAEQKARNLVENRRLMLQAEWEGKEDVKFAVCQHFIVSYGQCRWE